MKTQIIILITSLLVLVSCMQRNKIETTKQAFQTPIIIQEQTKDTIKFLKADSLREAWFKYIGKFKFTDTLRLSEYIKPDDSTYAKDFINNYSGYWKDDSLVTDGLQIFTDYETNIHDSYKRLKKGHYYFPVYIVNETSRTKIFVGKDDFVFALQEAQDTGEYYNWRPIESKGSEFCGNGYFGLKIHPGEFFMFLVPKYEGEEKQHMRVRLQIGESLYLSQFYEGTFNRKQFHLGKWTSERLKERKTSIQEMFYGAMPKEYDK